MELINNGNNNNKRVSLDVSTPSTPLSLENLSESVRVLKEKLLNNEKAITENKALREQRSVQVKQISAYEKENDALASQLESARATVLKLEENSAKQESHISELTSDLVAAKFRIDQLSQDLKDRPQYEQQITTLKKSSKDWKNKYLALLNEGAGSEPLRKAAEYESKIAALQAEVERLKKANSNLLETVKRRQTKDVDMDSHQDGQTDNLSEEKEIAAEFELAMQDEDATAPAIQPAIPTPTRSPPKPPRRLPFSAELPKILRELEDSNVKATATSLKEHADYSAIIAGRGLAREIQRTGLSDESLLDCLKFEFGDDRKWEASEEPSDLLKLRQYIALSMHLGREVTKELVNFLWHCLLSTEIGNNSAAAAAHSLARTCRKLGDSETPKLLAVEFSIKRSRKNSRIHKGTRIRGTLALLSCWPELFNTSKSCTSTALMHALRFLLKSEMSNDPLCEAFMKEVFFEGKPKVADLEETTKSNAEKLSSPLNSETFLQQMDRSCGLAIIITWKGWEWLRSNVLNVHNFLSQGPNPDNESTTRSIRNFLRVTLVECNDVPEDDKSRLANTWFKNLK